MFCCTNCLQDEHLYNLITNLGEWGQCDYCQSENIKILEVTKLKSQFEPLLEAYSPVKDLELYQNSDKNFSIGNITKQINEDWNNIFNNSDPEKLLMDILADDAEVYEKLFKNDVLLKLKYERKNRARNLIKKDLWEKFKTEIKSNYRFFRVESNEIEEFQNLLRVLSVTIPENTYLYRARISNREGYSIDKMGTPDPEKTSAGRANPKGIPYLYLSKCESTTIYEVRAGLHDYITVGKFQVLDKLRVVNFRPVWEMSPFKIGSVDLVDIIEYDSFIQSLMLDLSKPNRRFDTDIDYIPTQYIIEMVKKRGGIDGVEYPSTMDKSGRNIVLFQSNKVRCIRSKTFTVHNIKYEYETI
ncbi:MAG: RES domain-containing protein [Candidatus Marinimicrobia bacterium]|nr:RES domain-containing protein [Candidatus Neomarinimicrobiota bacterium]